MRKISRSFCPHAQESDINPDRDAFENYRDTANVYITVLLHMSALPLMYHDAFAKISGTGSLEHSQNA